MYKRQQFSRPKILQIFRKSLNEIHSKAIYLIIGIKFLMMTIPYNFSRQLSSKQADRNLLQADRNP
jgi:hypothetical protein